MSSLTARLSILLKHATLGNRKMREIENEVLAQKINGGRVFELKIEDEARWCNQNNWCAWCWS